MGVQNREISDRAAASASDESPMREWEIPTIKKLEAVKAQAGPSGFSPDGTAFYS